MVSADVGGQLLGSGLVAVEDDQVGTGVGQPLCHRTADAAGTSGHERDATGEICDLGLMDVAHAR
ncbi:hypothetical protein GCM10027273_23780 [Nocardioides pakistanensis]